MRYPLRPVQVTELRVEALLSGVLSGDALYGVQIGISRGLVCVGFVWDVSLGFHLGVWSRECGLGKLV